MFGLADRGNQNQGELGVCSLRTAELHWHHSKNNRPQLTSSDTTQYFIANYFIHLKEYIIVDKK